MEASRLLRLKLNTKLDNRRLEGQKTGRASSHPAILGLCRVACHPKLVAAHQHRRNVGGCECW